MRDGTVVVITETTTKMIIPSVQNKRIRLFATEWAGECSIHIC